MAAFDVDEFISRFDERARAVKARGLPPVAGPDRAALIAQAERDYTDFSLIAAAQWSIEEGSLVLRIPLGGR
jgi:hypothetical protein